MKRVNFGFTLIELLVVIAIIGMLSAILVVSINPPRQFAKARDSERNSELIAILSAVLQYSSEHSGALPDTDGDPDTESFPTSETCIGSGGGCFDLASAGDDGDTIVPVYLAELPSDPKATDPDADTGYTIYVDENEHLHASAVNAETVTIDIVR